MTTIEHLREEVMLCLIAQDYFDFDIFNKEIEQIHKLNKPLYAKILEEALYTILREQLDAILGESE